MSHQCDLNLSVISDRLFNPCVVLPFNFSPSRSKKEKGLMTSCLGHVEKRKKFSRPTHWCIIFIFYSVFWVAVRQQESKQEPRPKGREAGWTTDQQGSRNTRAYIQTGADQTQVNMIRANGTREVKQSSIHRETDVQSKTRGNKTEDKKQEELRKNTKTQKPNQTST